MFESERQIEYVKLTREYNRLVRELESVGEDWILFAGISRRMYEIEKRADELIDITIEIDPTEPRVLK